MISRLTGILGIGLVLAFITGGPLVASEARPECAVVLPAEHSGLRWYRAYPGLHLELGDALVTCAGAQATVRAECWLPFSHRFGKDPDVHRIGSNTLITFVSRARRPGGASVPVDGVDVLDVGGTVLYVRARDITGPARFPSALQVGGDAEVRVQAFERVRQTVGTLPGRPAVVGEHLGPWDVIRTGATGRIEIDAPRGRLRDGNFSVVDAAGEPTSRIRLIEHAFFVVHPRFFPAGVVLAVRGDVVVIRDADRIRGLLGTRVIVWGRLDLSDARYQERWQAVLRQSTLDE